MVCDNCQVKQFTIQGQYLHDVFSLVPANLTAAFLRIDVFNKFLVSLRGKK